MKGVYILSLKVEGELRIAAGGLGKIALQRGIYAYVGSAQNNLKKRVFRHVRKNKKLRWHIDYVTSSENVKAIAAYLYALPREYECKIAKELAKLSAKLFKGFGTSDCNCVSHFFKIDRNPDELVEEVSERIKAHPIIVLRFR